MRTLFYVVLVLNLLTLAPKAQAVPAEGHSIMIAGPTPYGPEIAREIHKKGGHVADVLVAVALSMAVTHPYYAAFGGGGFAMIKQGKVIDALDFRETAPAKASPDLYKDHPPEASRTGGLAIAVPGIPAGLYELHKKYGKLKWADLFAPAIRLAEDGFHVSGEWVGNTEFTAKRFNEAGHHYFLNAKGEMLKPGDLLKQPALAKFLKTFKSKGAETFYTGKTAQDVVDSANAAGGVLSMEDLKNYKVRWLKPMQAKLDGFTLNLMPPPSSGGVIIAQAVRLMEKTKIEQTKPLSVDEFHLLIEILKLSYRGRQLLGDPDFAKNPIDQLLNEKFLDREAALIKKDKSVDVDGMSDFNFEKDETTHLSVMDGEGNTISMTVTLNGDYGSAVVAQGTGIALNNEMDDFTTHLGKANMFGLIQGEGNQVHAGARPLSSMTPTIVEKDGRTVLSVGAPGGPRITSAVLQVIYRNLIEKFNIDQAIQAPRVHHQFLPNLVKYDAFRFTPETIAALESRGHKLEIGSTGKVAGIERDEGGKLMGACDSRGECAAGGE